MDKHPHKSPRKTFPPSTGAKPKAQPSPSKHECDFHCVGVHEEGRDVVVLRSPNRRPVYVTAAAVQSIEVGSSPKKHVCDSNCNSPRRITRNLLLPTASPLRQGAIPKALYKCEHYTRGTHEIDHSPRRSPRTALSVSVAGMSLVSPTKKETCEFHCSGFHKGEEHDHPTTSRAHVRAMSSNQRKQKWKQMAKKLMEQHQSEIQEEERNREEAQEVKKKLAQEKKPGQRQKLALPPITPPPKSPKSPKTPKSILQPGGRRRSLRFKPNVHFEDQSDKFKF